MITAEELRKLIYDAEQRIRQAEHPEWKQDQGSIEIDTSDFGSSNDESLYEKRSKKSPTKSPLHQKMKVDGSKESRFLSKQQDTALFHGSKELVQHDTLIKAKQNFKSWTRQSE